MFGVLGLADNPLMLEALGAAMLLAASVLVGVGVAGRIGNSPGWRAILHWLPIAVASMTARFLGHADMALGILFGTSVAILSTAVGSICMVAPVGPAPPRFKRIWPFTLVAALIVFVSGFNGLLTWKHGVALAVEGLVILSLWQERRTHEQWPELPPEVGKPVTTSSLADSEIFLIIGAMAVSLLFAGGGAYFATRGALGMTRLRARVSPGAIAASLLSLVLATPLIQSGKRLVLAGASWIPMSAQVGITLLNLCVLLPVLAIFPYLHAVVTTVRSAHGKPIDWDSMGPNVTVFPLAAWRIDTVVLILLSTLLLPVAMGRWNLGRAEGFMLIAGYCVYLLAVTVLGM
jgi:cation:H+ antiporter